MYVQCLQLNHQNKHNKVDFLDKHGEDRVSQQQLDHLSLCWLQGQDEGPGPHGRQGPPLLRVLVQVSLLGKNATEQNLSVCAVKYGAIFVCSSCHQRLETT